MSLYSDLNEVLTPYAQKIKGLTAADEEIKADLGSFNETGGADKYFSNVKVYGSPTSIGISNIRNNYGSADAKQTGFAIFPATTDTEWGSAIKNVTDAPVSGHFCEKLSDGRIYEFDYDLSGLTSGTRDIVRDTAHVIKKSSFYDIPAGEIEDMRSSLIDVEASLEMLDAKIDSVSGALTPEIKAALLNCFAHVGWEHNTDKSYYDALEEALYADNVSRIEAVLSLGTHEVYTTDNVESLRSFLTVTAYYDNDTNIVVTDYELEGDLTTTGTKTVTVKYHRSKRTTVNVPVVNNQTGILYEWDFTKGLRDLRQGVVAVLGTGDSDIRTSNIYDGTTPPILTKNGVQFSKRAQYICLFDTNFNTNNLFGKTVQVDVSEFDCAVDSTTYNIRFITFVDPNERYTPGSPQRSNGVVYRKNAGWSFYDGYEWKSSIYTGLSGVNDISGKRISASMSSSGAVTLYVDGQSKGTSQANTVNNHQWLGLYIGDGGYDGRFYNALISSVKIYNGEVVN